MYYFMELSLDNLNIFTVDTASFHCLPSSQYRGRIIPIVGNLIKLFVIHFILEQKGRRSGICAVGRGEIIGLLASIDLMQADSGAMLMNGGRTENGLITSTHIWTTGNPDDCGTLDHTLYSGWIRTLNTVGRSLRCTGSRVTQIMS